MKRTTDETDFRKVDELLGFRADRRKRYKIIDGEVCELARWTQSCSGCYETIDGSPFAGTERDKNGISLGSGCGECGYHGKVRMTAWVPVIL
jgi:Na+-translocating ferredoxin:NAD+ oxidoreductase RNF subunit RnfB